MKETMKAKMQEVGGKLSRSMWRPELTEAAIIE
jgi:hypothetical protein